MSFSLSTDEGFSQNFNLFKVFFSFFLFIFRSSFSAKNKSSVILFFVFKFNSLFENVFEIESAKSWNDFGFWLVAGRCRIRLDLESRFELFIEGCSILI